MIKRYVADFETTSESQSLIDGHTRVWAVGCIDIDTEEVLVLSNKLKDFMNWCAKDNDNHDTKHIYFHNLKFDGQFIVDFLLRNGFKHSTDRNLNAKEFQCLITSTGVWYSIKVCYRDLKTRKVQVTFYDSLKKLPFSVDKIAKSFKLPISKLSIDYDLYRDENHELTDDEKIYLLNDMKIVSRALNIQFSKGLTKMTIGSDALSFFKTKVMGKSNFDYAFPLLDNVIDKDLRQSYKGGWVYLAEKYKGIDVKNVLSFDVNSLYPYVMSGEHMLPFGEPRWYDGKYKQDDTYPLYIQFINTSFKLKENHLPTIQVKNNWLFKSTEYVKDTNGDVIELALTSVDLKLFLDHYDIDFIEYVEGFKFMGTKGMFDDYVKYWGEIKMNSTGALRELAKLMLNSLYGKFGTNPRKINLEPILIEDEVIYKRGEDKEENSLYVAMASYITSYARNFTIRTAQRLYKYFVYSDTDSLKLTGLTYDEASKLLDIDEFRFGAWKFEGMGSRGKFLRAKTYIIDGEDGPEITCAGLPKKARENITYDEFDYGYKTEGKLLQKKTKGGVILHYTTFEIVKT